ncbi:MAG: hypothetical protein H6Q64_891 [Firmicutes bacterium]|nr:hypothetical protein [Bacillota bacterium]
MKKTLSVLLSLLLLFAFSSMAVANPANYMEKNKVNKELKEKYRVQKEKKVQSETTVQNENEKKVKKASKFKDAENHWAKGSIDLLTEMGLFNGYPDGTFQPDQSVTQAECVELLMRLAGDDEEDTDEVLNEDEDTEADEDVPAWVQKSYRKAAKHGIINVNRFHSAVQADRALIAVWVAKAMKLEPVDTTEMPYSDYLLISKEDLGYILALYKEGLMKGSPDGKFNPNSCITRAEMATILQRILDEEATDELISMQESATLEQGKTLDLGATLECDDAYTGLAWSSSDTDLATVDEDGVVTAAADQTGVVTIKVTATNTEDEEDTISTSCEVTVVKEINAAELERTGQVGIHNNKIYEEYKLVADDEVISLDADNIAELSLTKNDEDPVTLTPDTDDTLWFNVQRETADYVLTAEDQDGAVYEAKLEWEAPEAVDVDLIGDVENDGVLYDKYTFAELNLSEVDKIYQIDPAGAATELISDSEYLKFDTSDPDGKYIYLVLDGTQWYTATIDFAD